MPRRITPTALEYQTIASMRMQWLKSVADKKVPTHVMMTVCNMVLCCLSVIEGVDKKDFMEMCGKMYDIERQQHNNKSLKLH